MNCCQNIDPSFRKVCWYPLIHEASKAIITSFRRVLSQCFYVLEPLRWCLHKEKCAGNTKYYTTGAFYVARKNVNFSVKKSNQVTASGRFRHDHARKNIPFVWH